MYKFIFKRVLDVALSLMGLIITLPLIIVLALLVKSKLGGPVIFTQQRPGLNGKTFKLYKFRTMTDEKDENGDLLLDHLRLTKFGKVLRSTSLDELPELYNIFKGDMSFIGPRPLLVEYLPLYNGQQRRRHEVRPGLSGLAQINGRNALNWEDRFELDVHYVDNLTFTSDLKIFFLTIKKVFIREGVNFEVEKKDNKFQGSQKNKAN